MFISAVPGSELAVWTHVTPSSWASLPLHSLPIPLGRPRAPSWAHCAMQQLPACYFTQDNIYIYIYTHTNQYYSLGLPWWLSGKIGACNAGDMGLIPGSGRFPGGGHSNPLWYSCLENPMGRKNLAVTAHGVNKESDTNEVTEHPHMLLSQFVTFSPSLHPCSQVLSLWGKHF